MSGDREKSIDVMLEVYKAIGARLLHAREIRFKLLYYWKAIIAGTIFSFCISMAGSVAHWTDVVLVVLVAVAAPVAAHLLDQMVRSTNISIKRDADYLEYHVEKFLLDYFATCDPPVLPTQLTRPPTRDGPEVPYEFTLYENYVRQVPDFESYDSAMNRRADYKVRWLFTKLIWIGAVAVIAVACLRLHFTASTSSSPSVSSQVLLQGTCDLDGRLDVK